MSANLEQIEAELAATKVAVYLEMDVFTIYALFNATLLSLAHPDFRRSGLACRALAFSQMIAQMRHWQGETRRTMERNLKQVEMLGGEP